MRLHDFSALTFDCYGTLIDWETGLKAGLAPWRRRLATRLDDQALLGSFAKIESRLQAERPKALYPELLAAGLQALGEELGTPATAAEMAAFGASVKDWPVFADSVAAMQYLNRHFKLVIVSNIDRGSFKHSNAKLGVVFDHVVTAQDVGSYKPAPAHFEAALAWLAGAGVPKAKVLHTAQSLFHDHVPAKRLGLTTMWINRQAGRPGATKVPDEAVKPDAEVASMAALVAMHQAEVPGAETKK
jgi:2-haloalkanoic acid dehalogenase type II